MARFLISTAALPGHLDWGGLLPTAERLLELGHEVLWLSGSAVAKRLVAVGIPFEAVPVAFEPPRDGPPPAETPALFYAAELQRTIDTWTPEDQVVAACTAHCAVIWQWQPDVVVADPMVLAAALAAEALDVPLAACGYPGPYLVLRSMPETTAVIAGWKAVQYEIPILICFSGNRRGRSDEEGIEHTVACLKRVAPYAEQKGITLVMEILNSKVDHRGYMFDRMSWGLRVVELVNSPRVKILYDIYHAQIMEGDIIRTIRTHHDKIAHYHTAGNPGRNEIDESQELYYPAIMRAIKDTGYTGYIGQEFIPKGDPLSALRRAYEICTV